MAKGMIEQAIFGALTMGSKGIITCDANESFALRFETDDKYIKAVFERTASRRRNYSGKAVIELTEQGELFVGIHDIDRGHYEENKKMAVGVAKFFALTMAFNFLSQYEHILNNSYILHFDVMDNKVYAVFEKQ